MIQTDSKTKNNRPDCLDILVKEYRIKTFFLGGARGVMVIVVGIGHGDMSSNPGRDCLHFT